jgi:hypothetical protein
VFFSGIDWSRLAKNKIKPPIYLNYYKSNDDSLSMDFNGIDLESFKDKDYNKGNKDSNRLIDFTFIRDEK